MLNLLRKKGVMKKILWAVAIVIIISFGFLGRANILDKNQRKKYAGKVFGRKVAFARFQMAYQQSNLQALLLYGEKFYKMRDKLDLISDAWDRLILLHEAQKRNIRIPDEEIVKTIAQYPFFQRNNKFDQDLYDNVLQRIFKMRPREFEEGVRNNLKIGQLYGQVTFPISLTDEEIYDRFKKYNERVKVSYVVVPTAAYADTVTISDDEARKYFEAHKKDFLAPPSINVTYLAFLIPKDTPEESKKEAKKEREEQAYDAYTDLIQNPDFAPVAQKFNIPAQETGFFNQSQINFKEGWSFELMQQAFQLSLDEITQPIETPEGFYILKLKKRKGAYIPEFSEVKSKVKEAARWAKAKELARTETENRLEKIKQTLSGGSEEFSRLAQSLGFEVKQTSEFPRGTYVPDFGMSQEFQEAAFALNQDNRLSGVVATPNGFAILWFESYAAPSQEQFENDKVMLSQQLLAEKKANAFGEFLDQLRRKAHLEDNVSIREKGENKGEE